jgi:hypothetical protein
MISIISIFFKNFFRISNHCRLKVFANFEFEIFFIDIQNVNINFDDNKNDERFDCMKYCKIFLNFRRGTNVTCARYA